MRPARPGRGGPGRLPPAHQEVVDRRFALLEAELSGLAEPASEPGPALVSTAVPAVRSVPSTRSVPPVAPVPPRLPVPGRHAARRGRTPPLTAWRRRGAEVLAARPAGEPGAWSLGPTHLTVVAVLVALGLALTTWWVVRSTPTAAPLAPPVPAAVATGGAAEQEPLVPGVEPEVAPPAAGGSEGAAPAAAPEVVVHVAGEVRRPGLVVLPVGSRVADAVEAAGGARRGTDLTSLNLARPLVDGEQVVVGPGTAAPTGPPGGGAVAAPGVPAPGALVDLNTADQALLETLPGIGPVTAAAILQWRDEHGGFTAVEELLEVDGIGEATLEDLAPLVTV